MAGFISIILGALIGYSLIKKQMEKRLYMVLTKSGLFNEQSLGVVMAYYRDYDKICKEVSKKQKDAALKMEADYRLNLEEKTKKL